MLQPTGQCSLVEAPLGGIKDGGGVARNAVADLAGQTRAKAFDWIADQEQQPGMGSGPAEQGGNPWEIEVVRCPFAGDGPLAPWKPAVVEIDVRWAERVKAEAVEKVSLLVNVPTRRHSGVGS